MSPAQLRIAAARKKLRHYDVGGAVKAVRNFFTGINGSKLDQVLDELKGSATAPFPPSVMQGAKEAGATPDEIAAAQRGRWIERNLRNYLIRQHGTENDPLREVMQNGRGYQNVLDTRGAADRWADLVGSDPRNHGSVDPSAEWFKKAAIQDWPRYADERAHGVDLGNIGYQPDQDTLAQKLQEIDAKHTARNNDPVNLYDIDPTKWRATLGPELHDTLDYLRANVDPRSLPQVSVPDAIRKSQEWHAAMAKKAAEANQALIAKLPVTKQYPNGAKWVQMSVAPEERNSDIESDVHQAAKTIGQSLGHCYQNPATCRTYLDSGELHTFIDANGKPRVTMEMSPAGAGMLGVYQADANGKPLMDIGQIHGPQFEDRNGPLDEDTIPYVKDYISSMPNVTSIGDKQDVLGLKKFITQGGFPRYLDPSQLPSEFARYRIPADGTTKLVGADDYVKAMAANRFAGMDKTGQMMRATQPQAEALIRKQMPDPASYSIPDDWTPPSDVGGKAAGGLIDQAGVYAGDIADAARSLLQSVRSGAVNLGRDLTGTVDGGHPAEKVLPVYGSRTKQANQEKLPGLKDKTANNLMHFGIVTSPEDAQSLVDSMTHNDDPLIAGASLGDEALETTHHVTHTANDYNDVINSSEDQNGLPPGMLSRVIRRESNFNPAAVSPKGALGIMQFMPGTAKEMGIDPLDPEQAIPAGAEYLRQLHDRVGNWRDALAAYNWGENNVLKYGYSHAPAETRKYVASIMGTDAAGSAIQRAKQSMTAQQALARRVALPAAAGAAALSFPDQVAGALPAQDDQSQNVSRETELSQAKRLTAPGTSSRMLSELDPDDALMLLALSSDDDEQNGDSLLGLLALLEGSGTSGRGEAAAP